MLLLQQHRRSSYCKRNRSCRFSFPQPPSSETLIAEPCESASDALDTLSKVRKVLSNKANESLSLDEVLSAAKVTHNEYSEVLPKGVLLCSSVSPVSVTSTTTISLSS